MKITVIIPTYRRPQDLARCLGALKKQTRPADYLLVIIRDTDVHTWKFLETFNLDSLPLQTVTVKVPGLVAALNAGLDMAKGDLIAFTDDDASPHDDWLAKIESHFLSDQTIAGVGGRDWVYHGLQLEDGACKVVGRLQWFGRVIGNHHLGIGSAREVDVLKGVNMSFRRTAIQGLHFDRRMRGKGSVINSEIPFCLALKRRGWKLIYDPKVAVDHYPGQRFDEDQRDQFNATTFGNIVHNETLALLEHLKPGQKLVFWLWAILVGTRVAPGFLQWLRLLPSEGGLAGQKLVSSLRGRWQGRLTYLSSCQGNITN